MPPCSGDCRTRRVGVVQEVVCWVDVPANLYTTVEICQWLDEHDKWPNVTEGEWSTGDVIFPEDT